VNQIAATTQCSELSSSGDPLHTGTGYISLKGSHARYPAACTAALGRLEVDGGATSPIQGAGRLAFQICRIPAISEKFDSISDDFMYLHGIKKKPILPCPNGFLDTFWLVISACLPAFAQILLVLKSTRWMRQSIRGSDQI
jgi:hypothetical protein